MGVTKGAVDLTVPVREFCVTGGEGDGGSPPHIDRIYANRGDRIRWDVGDRVVSIWFPERGVFVTQVLAVQHKGVVEATIPMDADDGVYEYCIYDHDARCFVVCESHPKLEIPKPGP